MITRYALETICRPGSVDVLMEPSDTGKWVRYDAHLQELEQQRIPDPTLEMRLAGMAFHRTWEAGNYKANYFDGLFKAMSAAAPKAGK